MLTIPGYFEATHPTLNVTLRFATKDAAAKFAGDEKLVKTVQGFQVINGSKEFDQYMAILKLSEAEADALDVGHIWRTVFKNTPSIHGFPNIEKLKEVLATPIKDAGFDTAAYNCFSIAKIINLRQLVQFHENDVLKLRNFGKGGLARAKEVLKQKGLSFGMDLTGLDLT